MQRCEKKVGMMKRRGDWYHSLQQRAEQRKEKRKPLDPKKAIFFPTHFLSSQTPPYFAFSFLLSLPCHTSLQFLFFNLLSNLSSFIREEHTKKEKKVSFTHTHTTQDNSFSLVWLHSHQWELVALNSLSAGGLPTSSQTFTTCLIMVTFLFPLHNNKKVLFLIWMLTSFLFLISGYRWWWEEGWEWSSGRVQWVQFGSVKSCNLRIFTRQHCLRAWREGSKRCLQRDAWRW